MKGPAFLVGAVYGIPFGVSIANPHQGVVIFYFGKYGRQQVGFDMVAIKPPPLQTFAGTGLLVKGIDITVTIQPPMAAESSK